MKEKFYKCNIKDCESYNKKSDNNCEVNYHAESCNDFIEVALKELYTWRKEFPEMAKHIKEVVKLNG